MAVTLQDWSRTTNINVETFFPITKEPFEGIPEDFFEKFIPQDAEEFQRILGNFDVDQLLGVLYEFIETNIKHSQKAEKGQM